MIPVISHDGKMDIVTENIYESSRQLVNQKQIRESALKLGPKNV